MDIKKMPDTKEYCYLCGEKLEERRDADDKPLKKGLAIKHGEHIIQNCLHGKIIDDSILCLSCGGKLSDEIDTGFCKIFESFTERLKHVLVSKDHGSTKDKKLKGYVYKENGEEIRVNITNGKVTPEKPFYFHDEKNNILRIYAHKKALEGYKLKVLKDLREGKKLLDGCTILEIDDMSDHGVLGYDFSNKVDNFSDVFKLGMSKIAIGFAVHKGISRSDMPLSLDTANQRIVYGKNIAAFFPYSVFDKYAESLRYTLEEGYPTHTIILYTEKTTNNKRLVCYVDLFSTFQYYIVLNDSYKGNDLHEIYYQTTLKQEKPDIKINRMKPKYIMVLSDILGVDSSEFEGKSQREIIDYINKKYKQLTLPYKRDIGAYLDSLMGRISYHIAMKEEGFPLNLSDIEKSMLDSKDELTTHEYLCLNNENNLGIENDVNTYRRFHIDPEIENNFRVNSTLAKMVELQRTSDFSQQKAYGYLKFYLLQQFINKNS